MIFDRSFNIKFGENFSKSKIAIIIFLLSFLFYLLFVRDIVASGDNAQYNFKIIDGKFNEVSSHWLYYVIGFIFINFLKISPSLGMNILSAFFGAIGVAMTFLLAESLTKNIRISLLSSFILLFSTNYFASSVFAEVYIVQTAFILLSLYFWIDDKAFLSGLFFLASMLVSPTSLLFLVFFFLGKLSWKKVFKFSISFVPFYLIYLFFNWQDLFFGGRGIFATEVMSNEIPYIIRLSKGLAKIGFAFFFIWLIIFLNLAKTKILIKKIKEHQKNFLIIISSATLIFLIYTKVMEFNSVIIIFPLISIILSVILIEIKKINRKIINRLFTLLLICFAIFNLGLISINLISNLNFKEICYNIQETTPSYVIADWDRGLIYWYYTGDKIWLNIEGLIYGYSSNGESNWNSLQLSMNKLDDIFYKNESFWILDKVSYDEVKKSSINFNFEKIMFNPWLESFFMLIDSDEKIIKRDNAVWWMES